MTDADQTDYTQAAKLLATLTALFTAATLALRVALKTAETGSIIEAVSFLSQFFTILTNALVLCMMLAVAVGVRVAPRVTKALTIAIVGVGIVYHVALAHLLDLSGIALMADHGVHTIVPAMTLFWWFLFAPKDRFHWHEVAVWITWPLFYCGYILLRAASSGFYPYPFLNLPELGAMGLAQSIFVLCLAFIVIGLALTALTAATSKRNHISQS